jgi:hypothetical protein
MRGQSLANLWFPDTDVRKLARSGWLTDLLRKGRSRQHGRVRLCATALGAILALLLPAAADAHPTVVPTSVTAGQRGTVTFVAPNERQVRQTGFAVTVAPDLAIVSATDADVGWPGAVRGSTATWSGCCVAPGDVASFSLELQAADVPGDVRLEVRQLYPNGERVRWPLTLTVLPGREESSSALTVLLVAGIGLVVTVGLVLLLWLRRAPTGREN